MEQRKQNLIYSQGNESLFKTEKEMLSLPLQCHQALGVGSGRQRVGRGKHGHPSHCIKCLSLRIFYRVESATNYQWKRFLEIGIAAKI